MTHDIVKLLVSAYYVALLLQINQKESVEDFGENSRKLLIISHIDEAEVYAREFLHSCHLLCCLDHKYIIKWVNQFLGS